MNLRLDLSSPAAPANTSLELILFPGGEGQCVYGEAIDLHALGQLFVTRASLVEPDDRGNWSVDLSLVGGPILGPFPRRTDALAAEQAWLREHWLSQGLLKKP